MAQRMTSAQLKSSVTSIVRGGGEGRSLVAEAAHFLRQAILPEHPAAASPRPAARRASRKPWVNRLEVILPRVFIVVATVMLVMALALFAFRAFYGNRIYPAVVVGDVPVGGLSMAQAHDKVQQRADQLEAGLVTFTYGGQTWHPTMSQIGASVQINRSLDQAHALGREASASERLQFTGQILRNDQTVPLRTTVNARQLNAWFDQVDKELGKPAKDATLSVNGVTVSVSPEATGTVVDRAAATKQILASLDTLKPVSVELPTTSSAPKVTTADLAAPKAQLEAALSRPVTVSFETNSWTLKPEDLSKFIVIKNSAETGKPGATLSMNEDGLAALLRDKFNDKVNRQAVDGKVGWNDNSGLVATQDSIDGITLMPTSFAKAVAASFLDGHGDVKIPVVVTKPEVDTNNLGALGITHRISRGDSNFAGGTPDRDNNIEVGIKLLNGALVKPGGEFSFNGAIGPITPDKGYTTAGVMVNGRVGEDDGGGICQVSTTVFRAAILGGFPIDEWWPHFYSLEGYTRDGWGPGFDASILQDGSDPSQWGDFKFQNNTSHWILVESYTSYPYAIVNIYGEDTGWKVNISDTTIGPSFSGSDVEVVNPDLPAGTVQQTEYPEDGFSASFVRTVYDKSGKEMYTRTFESDYQARGNVYQVSPDMKGKSPAAGATASNSNNNGN